MNSIVIPWDKKDKKDIILLLNEEDNLEYSSEAYLMKRKLLTDETEQI